MPVNSFDDYPMAFRPKREELTSPVYLSLANILERDIVSGLLPPGTKLPPQRELADYLDVNLSTITRVYKLCEEKGLLSAVTGRGTFVAPGADASMTVIDEGPGDLIDLGTIHAFYTHNSLVRDAAQKVLHQPFSERLFEYNHPLGTASQRQTSAGWLKKLGVNVGWQSVLMTAGNQNALAVTLTSLFSPGDKIAVDVYTYPNFIGLANMLHILLVPVAGDESGMLPEALEKACAVHRMAGVYLMPSLSNPTNIAIPADRREALAQVIRQNHLLLLEDDVYGFLQPECATPMFTLLSGQAVYLCGLSKPLAPGLRVGCIAAPMELSHKLAQGIYCINVKAPALNAEIAAALIADGTYEQVIREKREMAQERNKIFYDFFPCKTRQLHTLSQWMILPEGLGGRTFELLAEAKGVRVFGAERFCVGEGVPQNAARIATSTPRSLSELESGLRILQGIITEFHSGAPQLIV